MTEPGVNPTHSPQDSVKYRGVILIDGSNLTLWEYDIMRSLYFAGALTPFFPNAKKYPATATDFHAVIKGMDIILSSLHPSIRPRLPIPDDDKPAEVIPAIKNLFLSATGRTTARNFTELATLKQLPGESITAYSTRLYEIVNKLQYTFPSLDLAPLITSSLLTNVLPVFTPTVEQLFASMQAKKVATETPEYVLNYLKDAERSLENDAPLPSAFHGNPAPTVKKPMMCYNCSGPHHRKECTFRGQCSHCQKVGHTVANCRSKAKGAPPSSGANTAGSHSSYITVYLDSGCHPHLLSVHPRVSMRAISPLSISSIDPTSKLQATHEGFLPRFGRFLYTPSGSTNLLSVTELTRQGYQVTFSGSVATLTHSDTTVATSSRNTQGLYPLTLSLSSEPAFAFSGTPSPALPPEHVRYGHLSYEYLRRVFPKLKPFKLDDCDICIKSKLTSSPVTRTHFSERYETPGELVFGDLLHWPLSTTYNTRYALVLRDACTRYMFVMFLSNKTSPSEQLLAWFKIQPHRIQELRFDRGSEFTNSQLVHALQSTGVRVSFTPTATPQCNLTESATRVLNNVTRSILFQSGLPLSFWPDAMQNAVFLLNRLPTAGINFKCPITLWNPASPPVSTLLAQYHPLGARALYKDQRHLLKTSSRAREALILAPSLDTSSDTLRLWDVLTERIVQSRDARVFDDQFPFKKAGLDHSLHDLLPDDSDFPVSNAGSGSYALPTPSSSPSSTVPSTDNGVLTPSAQPDSSGTGNLSDVRTPPTISPRLVSLPDPDWDDSWYSDDCLDHDDVMESDDETVPVDQQFLDALLPTAEPVPDAPTSSALLMDLDADSNKRPAPDSAATSIIGDHLKRHGTLPRDLRALDLEVTTLDRSKRRRLPPSSIIAPFCYLTYSAAMVHDRRAEYQQAAYAELRSFIRHNVFELLPLSSMPPASTALTTTWAIQTKYTPEGEPRKDKARLTVRGFTQPASDIPATFAPVLPKDSLRIFLSVAASRHLVLGQGDIATAFLHAELPHPVYVHIPQGFHLIKGDLSPRDQLLLQHHYSKTSRAVLRVSKAVYGLKASPRVFYKDVDRFLRDNLFHRLQSDDNIYTRTTPAGFLMLGVYVDDLLIAASTQTLIDEFTMLISSKFEYKDLGRPTRILGMDISVNDKSITLSQSTYIKEVLDRFRMTECKAASTPLQPNFKFDPVIEHDPQPAFASIVGCLRYLADSTRPDLAFSTSKMAQYLSKHDHSKYTLLQRILRYLRGTQHLGLTFPRNPITSVTGYSDASWADDPVTRRTSFGHIILLNNTPVVWSSSVAKAYFGSTCEAEYVSASAAARELLGVSNLLTELLHQSLPLHLLVDNQSTILIAKGEASVRPVRHLELRVHHIRELAESGKINITYVPTDSQLADITTKALPVPQHMNILQKLFQTNCLMDSNCDDTHGIPVAGG